LWFQSLFDAGRGFAFPCDAKGRVDIDTLSAAKRDRYLIVRAMIGYDYAMPVVQQTDAVAA
jgi:hypothetical protein